MTTLSSSTCVNEKSPDLSAVVVPANIPSLYSVTMDPGVVDLPSIVIGDKLTDIADVVISGAGGLCAHAVDADPTNRPITTNSLIKRRAIRRQEIVFKSVFFIVTNPRLKID